MDDEPTCAQVCSADAMKKGEDWYRPFLYEAAASRSNCVLACPFGIPKMMGTRSKMMKCDMCYDSTL